MDPTQLTPLSPILMNMHSTLNIAIVGRPVGVPNPEGKPRYALYKLYKLNQGGLPVYRAFFSEFRVDAAVWNLSRHVCFHVFESEDDIAAAVLNGKIWDAALVSQTIFDLAHAHAHALDVSLQNVFVIGADSLQENLVSEFDPPFAGRAIALSATHSYNMDALAKFVVEQVPVTPKDFASPPVMCVMSVREGVEFGGRRTTQYYGVVVKGILELDQTIDVTPGLIDNGNLTCTPVRATVLSLTDDQRNLIGFVAAGGIVTVHTLDLTAFQVQPASGGFRCQYLGVFASLPSSIFGELEVRYTLLQDGGVVFYKNEILMVGCSNYTIGCKVLRVHGGIVTVQLISPLCLAVGDTITFKKKVGGGWRLVSFGRVEHGEVVAPEETIVVPPLA